MLFTKCNILVSIRLCPIPVNGRLLTCQAFFWALGRKFVNASCNSLPAVAPKSCPRLIVLSTWKQLGVCDRVPVEHVVSGDISCFSFPIALFGKAAHRNHKERRRSRYRFVISVFFSTKVENGCFPLLSWHAQFTSISTRSSVFCFRLQASEQQPACLRPQRIFFKLRATAYHKNRTRPRLNLMWIKIFVKYILSMQFT